MPPEREPNWSRVVPKARLRLKCMAQPMLAEHDMMTGDLADSPMGVLSVRARRPGRKEATSFSPPQHPRRHGRGSALYLHNYIHTFSSRATHSVCWHLCVNDPEELILKSWKFWKILFEFGSFPRPPPSPARMCPLKKLDNT